MMSELRSQTQKFTTIEAQSVCNKTLICSRVCCMCSGVYSTNFAVFLFLLQCFVLFSLLFNSVFFSNSFTCSNVLKEKKMRWKRFCWCCFYADFNHIKKTVLVPFKFNVLLKWILFGQLIFVYIRIG